MSRTLSAFQEHCRKAPLPNSFTSEVHIYVQDICEVRYIFSTSIYVYIMHIQQAVKMVAPNFWQLSWSSSSLPSYSTYTTPIIELFPPLPEAREACLKCCCLRRPAAGRGLLLTALDRLSLAQPLLLLLRSLFPVVILKKMREGEEKKSPAFVLSWKVSEDMVDLTFHYGDSVLWLYGRILGIFYAKSRSDFQITGRMGWLAADRINNAWRIETRKAQNQKRSLSFFTFSHFIPQGDSLWTLFRSRME